MWILLGLAAALLVSVACGVAFGSQDIAPGDVLAALSGRAGIDEATRRIIWELRLPRVVLAAVVGGGLSIVGVSMQTLVRNPLAEPYILGISGGASAGASLFYLGFLPPLLSKTLSMPLAAFAGGLIAITVVYLVARSGSVVSVARLLLAGVAVAALMGAITALVTFASPEAGKLRTVLFWLQGSLSGSRWDLIPVPAVATLFGGAALLALSRPLDAMLLGEEPARSLGIPIEMLKRILIVLAALITGTLVATSGAIGFVGLIVPHAVRQITGVAHRRLIPGSFLLGAVFLIWADVAARTLISAQELPVGAVTALCGVPFFLILLRGKHYRFQTS
ncbi:MAG: iron ABC transporter permease [Rhodothermales bacterium]